MNSISKMIAFVGSLCLLTPSAAWARVTVASNGADGNAARIIVQSVISKGDLAALRNAVEKVDLTAPTVFGVPFVTIELNSPGGDVVEALGMGKLIFEHSAMTKVRANDECVSACVFILIAGAVRTTEANSRVGVHRPLLVSWYHMDYREARAKYEGLMEYLRTYFIQLGVSEDAFRLMMNTGSSDMRYFSPRELDLFGMRWESPEWGRHYSVTSEAGEASDKTASAVGASKPKLPKIDPSYRYVVFMPGDLPLKNYLAGVDIVSPNLAWDSLDGTDAGTTKNLPSPADPIKALYRWIWPIFKQGWWLIALFVFEVLRGGNPLAIDRPN